LCSAGPTIGIEDCATMPCQNGAACTNGWWKEIPTLLVSETMRTQWIMLDDMVSDFTCRECDNLPGSDFLDNIDGRIYPMYLALDEGDANATVISYMAAFFPGQQMASWKRGTLVGSLPGRALWKDTHNHRFRSENERPTNAYSSIFVSDGRFRYTCDCRSGFFGHDCEIERDVDECESNPCEHGARCIDGEVSYSCVCSAGWQGVNCGTGVQPANPPLCEDDATWTDGTNGCSAYATNPSWCPNCECTYVSADGRTASEACRATCPCALCVIL
jgi:hypothetical protein